MKKIRNITFVVQIIVTLLVVLSFFHTLFFTTYGVPYPGYQAPFSIISFIKSLIIKIYIPISAVSFIVSLLAIKDKFISRKISIILFTISGLPLFFIIIGFLFNLFF